MTRYRVEPGCTNPGTHHRPRGVSASGVPVSELCVEHAGGSGFEIEDPAA